MKFGLFISPQHSPEDSLADKVNQHVEQVAVAKESGFDSVFMGQHLMANPYAYMHPLPMLARLAAAGPGMFFGTGVLLVPLYQPVDLAEQLATLDAICQGKLILGAGMGYRDEEFEAMGLKKSDRLGRMKEGLALMKRLWTEENVTFEGKHFKVQNVTSMTRPVQKPHIPIWLGAKTDVAVKRAAQIADAWIMTPSDELETLERQVQLYRETRASVGKASDAEIAMIAETCVAPTQVMAMRDAEPFIRNKYAAYAQWKNASGDNVDEFFGMEKLLNDRFIIGNPEHVTAVIKNLNQRLGVNHFLFRMQWPGMEHANVLRTIRLLGSEVIPAFR